MWPDKACSLCGPKGQGAEKLGPLLGPLADAKGGGQELYVHRLCALWSPEVYQTEQGTLRKVLAAVRRGRQMHCSHCGKRGATLGCLLERCPCSFHLPCAGKAGCTFHCSSYTLACKEHARLFPQKPEDVGRNPFTLPRPAGALAGRTPGGLNDASTGGAGGTPGGDFLSPPTALPLPKQPGRKRGRHGAMEIYDHMMAARAALKRARRELRAVRHRAAAESSDDEEHFAKKEAARLARDKARLNPVTLGGGGRSTRTAGGPPTYPSTTRQEGGGLEQLPPPPPEQRAGGMRVPTDPRHPPQQLGMVTGGSSAVAEADFGSIAGLDSVVGQLREMVLLPLIYPQLFRSMGITPPRGILFYGEPGTGKTLAARALAGACAKHSPTPVTFFARKGADCLGKFSGEAERTLRLLFEEASARAPAIIFLDELDALVPSRAARAGGSDQIYASVVSTLLSLMDGISDRGNVVVIGATNRPEAIDPALRRPGRFDREVYFGLPGPEQRTAILQVHTRRWPHPQPLELLQQVAGLAEGYAGADLQALCTAAVMAALRRAAPALLERAERTGGSSGAIAVAAALMTPQEPSAGGAGQEPRLEPQQQQEQPGIQQSPPHHQQQQGRPTQQQQGSPLMEQLLASVDVEPRDWWEALAAAPAPCSRRHGLAALSAGAARPLSHHLLPLVAPALRQALTVLHSSGLPLPPCAAAASSSAASAAAGVAVPAVDPARGGAGHPGEGESGGQSSTGGSSAAFGALMVQLGAVLPSHRAQDAIAGASAPLAGQLPSPPHQRSSQEPGAPQEGDSIFIQDHQKERSQQLQPGGVAKGQGRAGGSCWVPCRLLLTGEGELGQEEAAGAVLKLLEGCPVHTVSLPTAVVAGGGDATAGCVAIVGEALRRASAAQPCVFYLPRLEAWALHQTVVPAEELGEGTGRNAQKKSLPVTAGVAQGGSPPTGLLSASQGLPALGRPGSALGRAGAASPTFGHPVTPGAKGFPTAPSPFSGLLPLEERAPNTPSAAHALREEVSHQAPQHQQHQHRLVTSFSGGLGPLLRADSASSGPQPRQVLVAARYATAAAAITWIPSATTGGAAAEPGPVAGPDQLGHLSGLLQERGLAKPEDRSKGAADRHLPRIRTSVSPDGGTAQHQPGRQRVQEQQSQQQQGVPQLQQQEECQPCTAEVEITRLSEAWSVFESLIKQAPRSQPLLVLGTCHAPLASLPPLLLSFFGAPCIPGSNAVTTAAGAVADVTGSTKKGGVVVMEVPTEQQWEGCLEAAGAEVAVRIAAHAASALHDRLAAEQAQRPSPLPTASSQGLRGSGATTTRQELDGGQGTPVEGPAGADEPPVLAPTALAAMAAAAVPLPPSLSRAELQLGLQIVGQVSAFLRTLGARLLRNPRCQLACALVPPAPAEPAARFGRGGGNGSGGKVPQEALVLVSMQDVAQRAKRGGYASIEELLQDAYATAGRILAAVHGRKGSRKGSDSGPDPAAAAATCALLDEIEARCHALQQQLGLLSQPEHARLTALAQQHVAAVQQASQAALEREGARLVGRRLKVYWPEDQAWYIGSVAAFRGGRHWVVYADGDQEWVVLAEEKFELLPLEGTTRMGAEPAGGPGPGQHEADPVERQQQQQHQQEQEERLVVGEAPSPSSTLGAVEQGGDAGIGAAEDVARASAAAPAAQCLVAPAAAPAVEQPGACAELAAGSAAAAHASLQAAAARLQGLICQGLPPSEVALRLRQRAMPGSRGSGALSVVALEAAMAGLVSDACAVCDQVIGTSTLPMPPALDEGLQRLVQCCMAGVLKL